MTDSDKLKRDVAGLSRKAGITVGASAGAAAGGAVINASLATGAYVLGGTLVAAAALPVLGAFAGWKIMKALTEKLDPD